MATVDVTSWSEFLEAAAVSGDTVNCPEYAEWDLAAIEPGGHTGSITINATINGNGTKIKNLVIEHGVDQYGATFNIGGTTINDLHILNANLVGGGNGLFSGNYIMNGCTISAIVHDTGYLFYFGNYKRLYRCAFNIEIANATAVNFVGSNTNASYCNVKIAGSRVTNVLLSDTSSYPYGEIENSYFILDTPSVQTLTARKTSWSVIRCTGSNVTSLDSFSHEHFCLGVTTDFPNASTIGSGIILVSESQLRDAAYLQSIGFPIGVSD